MNNRKEKRQHIKQMIKYFKKKLNLKEINRELNKKKMKQDKN